MLCIVVGLAGLGLVAVLTQNTVRVPVDLLIWPGEQQDLSPRVRPRDP